MQHKESGFLSLGPHGFHRIAYTQWGDGHSKRVVVCVHGLTRNGRDFDDLAMDLANDPGKGFRVSCPDLPGRGHSHWLSDPADYALPVYMSDMSAMIARLGVEQVDWVGTSLGGLIGMSLAAQPNSPIRSLVMNDIGPFVPAEALKRIGEYVGHDEKFNDYASLKTYLMNVHASFGNLSDENWDHLCRHSGRKNEDGTWVLHYDPSIAVGFRSAAAMNIDLWPLWEQISCPVLILRGEDSDVLPREVAHQMLERGPAAEMIEFPGTGHAPSLMEDSQIDAVRSWLLAVEG
ncbi:MAG: alpha/beta hydrolase [Rhodospirillales bacterium]|nr:alpha/beta hydrolase [Rhodospirillales bacterium]